MKRKTLIAIGIAVAVVLAGGGGFAYSAMNNRTSVGTAEVTTAALAVSISASGSLVPGRSAGVYPPAAGTIAKVLVRDGDSVTKGQVLAELSKGPLQLALAQARAAHSAALAQLDAVNRGVPSGVDRNAANAALSAARSQVSTANQNYADFKRAYDAATPEEQEGMLATLRTLRTARTQADAALKAAKSGVNKLTVASRVATARTAAQQAVSAADSALEVAEANLDKAALKAPFAGTVSRPRTTEVGAGVTPGVAVFTVVDPAKMEFEALINQTDIAKVEIGQATAISLDAFAETGFTGTVTRIQAAPQTTATGSVAFAVTVAFDPGERRLFAGMSGSAEIEVASIPDALTVPVESVVTTGTAKTVFVINADGTVAAREVTVGAATDTAVQILSGLSRGETVVTTGATGLTDGQRVSTN